MMGENRNGLTGVGVNQRGQMLGLFAPKLTPILSFTERVQGDQPDRIIFDRIVDEVAVGGEMAAVGKSRTQISPVVLIAG
jgi:hypothetical protein